MSSGREFQKTNLSKRVLLSNKILSTYPDRVPVILIVNSDDFPQLKKYKYLAPSDSSLGKFKCEIYKHFEKLPPVFHLSAGKMMLPVSTTMEQLYSQYKDPDGFMYIYITGENSFG